MIILIMHHNNRDRKMKKYDTRKVKKVTVQKMQGDILNSLPLSGCVYCDGPAPLPLLPPVKKI